MRPLRKANMTAASFSREIGLSHEVEGGTLLARRLDLYPSVGDTGEVGSLVTILKYTFLRVETMIQR